MRRCGHQRRRATHGGLKPGRALNGPGSGFLKPAVSGPPPLMLDPVMAHHEEPAASRSAGESAAGGRALATGIKKPQFGPFRAEQCFSPSRGLGTRQRRYELTDQGPQP